MRLFGEHGFRATTMRLIAEHADVSPALVVHHFGSKQGLRDAIDEALADQIREGEFEVMTGSMSFSREEYFAQVEEYEDAMPYLARALTEGDDLGRSLFDRLYSDAVEYMAAGVEAGVVRPSDDPEARTAALLAASFGVLLTQHHVQRVLDADDDIELMGRIAPAMLEFYTHGLFTDDRALRSWHDREEHDARTADPDPPASDDQSRTDHAS